MPDNANKRAREGSSSSTKSDEAHSEITLKSTMQKLECIQESLDLNFAEDTSEINNLWADVNARLSILKNTTDDLKTSLDAAWVEIEALKQQDEQNRFQLAEFAKENAQLQAEVSATKARAIKLDNFTRRENIRLVNVPESQDENCKEILCRVMAAVKMEGVHKVEFHAVYRIGKQRDDGKPRPIIAQFIKRETRNDLWHWWKELTNSPNHWHVILVPDNASETAKEQKKVSNASQNARRLNLSPAYIKNRRIFVQGIHFQRTTFQSVFRTMKLFQWTSKYPLHLK